MADTFYLKKGATLPMLEDILQDGSGPVTLDGVGFLVMNHQYGNNLKIDYVLADPQTGDTKGKISVDWNSVPGFVDDMQTGIYYVEYHHTYENGQKAIWPTNGTVIYDRIEVLPALDVPV